MYISSDAQNIASLALAAICAMGAIILHARFRSKQIAYLKRFRPVEGIPLNMPGGGNPFSAVSRGIWQAMFDHQPDWELERLRLDVWRRCGYVGLWIVGFPVASVGIATLLLATGVIYLIAK